MSLFHVFFLRLRTAPARWLALAAGLCAAWPVTATVYMASMDKAQWQVERTAARCRLSQPIPRFGAAVFETRARDRQQFYLAADRPLLPAGFGQLLAAAPLWNPGRPAVVLGPVPVAGDRQPLRLDGALAAQLLYHLNDGMVPELHLPQPGAAVPLRVGVTPVNFRRAYGEYRACTARLPPAPAPKAAVVAAAPAGGGMRVAFDSNRWQLNAGAREQLDRWLGGLGATAQVAVDGHSGDSPRRVLNLELSRRRAEAVTDYLVERGVERERIVTRFHGERRAGNGARHVEVRQQHAAR